MCDCDHFPCVCMPDTYTRDDARDDHAINQWEIANDLRDEA